MEKIKIYDNKTKVIRINYKDIKYIKVTVSCKQENSTISYIIKLFVFP